MNNRTLIHQREIYLYFFAMMVSLLLSFWLDYRESVINPDAICYLLSAESIGNNGIHYAMQLCGQAKWPFFSLLIYAIVQISHVSYLTAAYFLNSLFSSISVLFFLLIVKTIDASRRHSSESSEPRFPRVLWLAAICILLAHEFNSVREYIIRDHGFWAFYLISIFFLIQFFRKPCLYKAMAWSASLVLATLFRIEGALFLLAMPFLFFFNIEYRFRERVKFFFWLNLPLCLLACSLLGWFILHPQKTLESLGRVSELGHQFHYGLMIMIDRFQMSKAALATHVLTVDSAKDAGFVFIIMLISWYLVSVINNLSWAYALLVMYGLYKKLFRFALPVTLVLCGYLVINIFVTYAFLVEHLFLSKRYLIALSLILMIYVPFALDHLMLHRRHFRARIFLTLSLLMILFSASGGIFDFGYSKAYIHQAGDWITNNVPKNAALYVNDYQLMYYSHHFDNNIFNQFYLYKKVDTFANGEWKQYDYIALRLDKHSKLINPAVLKGIAIQQVQLFSNTRGDKVVIYKVVEPVN